MLFVWSDRSQVKKTQQFIMYGSDHILIFPLFPYVIHQSIDKACDMLCEIAPSQESCMDQIIRKINNTSKKNNISYACLAFYIVSKLFSLLLLLFSQSRPLSPETFCLINYVSLYLFCVNRDHILPFRISMSTFFVVFTLLEETVQVMI